MGRCFFWVLWFVIPWVPLDLACLVAAGVKISVEQAAELRELACSRDVVVASRARIVLWSGEGRRSKDIAELLGVSLPTVDRWKSRYAQRGVAGMEGDRPGGAPGVRTCAGAGDPRRYPRPARTGTHPVAARPGQSPPPPAVRPHHGQTGLEPPGRTGRMARRRRRALRRTRLRPAPATAGTGPQLRFRLTANPVQNTNRPDKPTARQKARTEAGDRRSFRLGHRTAAAQLG